MAQRTAATRNAPLNPCVRATGSADPPSKALVVRLVETVERIARPSEPPTCWVVLSSPDAEPRVAARDPVGRRDRDRYERQPQARPHDDHGRQYMARVVAVALD